ncbi:hypothetical protein [Nannocystis pusilla]|uniref:hypothetical protein n=1 Tax=Nannocystis pusilla TaxID=889268 RepID=UPI003DA2C631
MRRIQSATPWTHRRRWTRSTTPNCITRSTAIALRATSSIVDSIKIGWASALAERVLTSACADTGTASETTAITAPYTTTTQTSRRSSKKVRIRRMNSVGGKVSGASIIGGSIASHGWLTRGAPGGRSQAISAAGRMRWRRSLRPSITTRSSVPRRWPSSTTQRSPIRVNAGASRVHRRASSFAVSTSKRAAFRPAWRTARAAATSQVSRRAAVSSGAPLTGGASFCRVAVATSSSTRGGTGAESSRMGCCVDSTRDLLYLQGTKGPAHGVTGWTP